MTGRVQLGWRVPADTWDAFETFVAEKHGSTAGYLRFEVEYAMREYLDEDDVLADAEELLEEHADLRGLSSSTALVTDDRYRGTTTRKVSHRISADLKERFQIFADKHEASSYGRLLAAALDTYADGGRARRILDDVERLVTGGVGSGTTTDSKENDDSTATESGTTAGAEERLNELDLSTETESGTSSDTTEDDDPEPRNVIAQANDLPPETFPKRVVEQTIADVVGNDAGEVVEAYLVPVLEQKNASEHPHRENLYITDEWRKSQTIWADLDRAERIVLLRRFAAADAVEHGDRRRAFTYKQIQALFHNYAGGGQPSHQYAYDLMADAADEDGFKYGEHRGQKQLRVDLQDVNDSIMEFVIDEKGKSAVEELHVDGLITSYTSGSSSNQEAVSDD